MASRPNTNLLFRPIKDSDTDKNFKELAKWVASLGPIALAKTTPILDIATGDNTITTPIDFPIGRITIYIDTAVTLLDKGSGGSGRWIINASGSCKARFLFL